MLVLGNYIIRHSLWFLLYTSVNKTASDYVYITHTWVNYHKYTSQNAITIIFDALPTFIRNK